MHFFVYFLSSAQAGMLLTSMSTETGEHRTHLLHLTLHSVSAFSTIIEDYGGEATAVPSAFSASKVRSFSRLGTSPVELQDVLPTGCEDSIQLRSRVHSPLE